MDIPTQYDYHLDNRIFYSSFVFNRNQMDIQCTKPTWVKSMKSQAQGIKIAVLFSRTEHNTQLVHRLNITHKNIWKIKAVHNQHMTTPMKTRLSRSTLSALFISVAWVTITGSERNYSTYQLAPRLNKRTARLHHELPASWPTPLLLTHPALLLALPAYEPAGPARNDSPSSRTAPSLLTLPPLLAVGRVRVHVQALFECIERLQEKEYLWSKGTSSFLQIGLISFIF
jgi:hypothetical protein